MRDQRELYLVMRAQGDPATLGALLRERIRSLDPGVPIRDLATMENRLSGAVANPARLTWLLGAFAAAAVVLAALGVFGVLSYIVAGQRKEIGVRIALGADRAAIIGMVLRRGMTRTLAGLAVGIVIALQGKRVLDAMLFGVSATDWSTFALTSLLLLAVAFVACWLPGRRAASIEPAEALRFD
jgi:predicted lysophospholipase L1 biosynthesis ABC-type transport system permease subunit